MPVSQTTLPLFGVQSRRFSTSAPAVLHTNPTHPTNSGLDQAILRFGTSEAQDSRNSQSNPLLNPQLDLAEFSRQATALASAEPARQGEAMAQLTEVLDQYLQGLWTEKNQPGKRDVAIDTLRQMMGPRGQGNTVMAQIDSVPGDLPGNATKIMAYLNIAERIGADSVVFPEMALMGYPIRDVIGRHPFLVQENVEWLKAIASRTKNTRAIVGFVEPRAAAPGEKPTGKNYFNAAAVLGSGKIEGIIRKSLLPTYGEFNEYRQFEPAPASGWQAPETLGQIQQTTQAAPTGKTGNIHGQSVGITICEDIWNDRHFFDRPMYARDPYAEVAAEKPAIMINTSASPSRARKEQLKHNMLTHVAQSYGIPLVYVNRVGAIDEHSFDGASRVYDQNGKLVARAKSFKEQFMIANPLTGLGKIEPLPPGLEEANQPQTGPTEKSFNPYDTHDLGRTYESIVQGIRGYFQKTGHTKATLGLSGGLDSTIAAVLLADALGPENVLGISMPSKITQKSSRDDARILAKNLGIHFEESPIVSIIFASNRVFDRLFKEIQLARPLHWLSNLASHYKGSWLGTQLQKLAQRFEKADASLKSWGERMAKSNTIVNLQARIRANILWAVSNEFKNAMPIATSDKSELYMGYATINGDMSGGFAPICDVPKTKLFTLGHWMNKHRAQKNAIPAEVLKKRPGAELEIDKKTGKPLAAEDDLMPYEFLDEVIWRIESLGQGYQDMLQNRPHPMLNEPSFWYERERGLDADTKKAWLDKFFRKMQSAVFKWTLLPPGLIVDGQSILKADYQVPITSRVPWQGHTPDEKNQILNEGTRPS